MKYVLKSTSYQPGSGMVEELYVRNIEGMHCRKLSDAMVWDSFDELAKLVEDDPEWPVRIVSVSERKLFEARLKDK